MLFRSVFGPKPRTYDSKLNKKVKSLARCSALSYKAAVEQMCNVTVADVNTLNYHGKRKQRYTKAGLLKGRTNHFKKAYVTLAGEDKIDFYANI